MLPDEFYKGREQTYVKHFVLEKYLERLAYIVGYYGQTINYIDGFAGPWQQVDERLADTSPFIAITKLREARDALAKQRKGPLNVNCFFVEQGEAQCAKLRSALADIKDVPTEAHCGSFEDFIGRAVQFAGKGSKSFCFAFIDPTGWTGYGLDKITPLLRASRGEVLINFMTKDILRFVDHPEPALEKSFADLFGDTDYRAQWRGLAGPEREAAIVSAYMERLKAAAGYKFVTSTIVFHPSNKRTHFHLVYGTRDIKGLEVFRSVERKAFEAQEGLRAAVSQRKRMSTGQSELFGAVTLGDDEMMQARRASLVKSREVVEATLKVRQQMPYDELFGIALSRSFTWERDLKEWLAAWRKSGQLALQGLKANEKVPHVNEGHIIRWL